MTTHSEGREAQGGPVATTSAASIRDAQGYTYANVVDRLCNRREKTSRNSNVACYRKACYSETAVRAYWQAFDAVATPCPEPSPLFTQCHAAGVAAACATNGFCPASFATKRGLARSS